MNYGLILLSGFTTKQHCHKLAFRITISVCKISGICHLALQQICVCRDDWFWISCFLHMMLVFAARSYPIPNVYSCVASSSDAVSCGKMPTRHWPLASLILARRPLVHSETGLIKQKFVERQREVSQEEEKVGTPFVNESSSVSRERQEKLD